MTAWILTHSDGFPMDENMFDLYVGFKELGEDVKMYNVSDVIFNNLPITENDIVVGHVDHCRRMFRQHGAKEPAYLDYPEELRPFMGRNYWQETLGDFRKRIIQDDYKPLFIKSVQQKQFTGFMCHNFGDSLHISDLSDDVRIWVSEPIHFDTEFRTYIHKHDIVGCIRYKGEPWYAPKENKVIAMLDALKNANMPIAYSIDVGIQKDKPDDVFLVECNDAFALGNYGINPRNYAEMLRDRWYQIIREK
jgi:hypothetical protein